MFHFGGWSGVGGWEGSTSYFLKVFHETAKIGSESRLKMDIQLSRFDQKIGKF